MQQDYARVSGVVETLQIQDLVEDALRLNSGALDRHGIKLVREYAEIQPISIDKRSRRTLRGLAVRLRCFS
jgi:hypothetical protein